MQMSRKASTIRPHAYIDSFGARLRRTRLSRGLSMQELARSSSVSVAAISRYERDLSWPSVFAAADLAAALGVTIDSLTQIHTRRQTH